MLTMAGLADFQHGTLWKGWKYILNSVTFNRMEGGFLGMYVILDALELDKMADRIVGITWILFSNIRKWIMPTLLICLKIIFVIRN